MYHELHTVTEFAIVAPYTLHIHFEDGHRQTIDFLPMLRGELFGPLRNLSFFNRAELDEEAGTIVWPNGADFDPATLYDWDRVGPAMIAMAKSWADSPAAEALVHSLVSNS